MRHLNYRLKRDTKLPKAQLEEIITQMLVDEAEEGGMKSVRDGFGYNTLRLLRGENIIFLPSWVHAGTCVPADSDCINYRLHAYLVRPGVHFDPHKTSETHMAYETLLGGFAGLDYDLSS